MDDALLSFRRSLTDVAAPLLEELEPLSPASMQVFERPLRVADWSRVNVDAQAAAAQSASLSTPVTPELVPSYEPFTTAGSADADRKPTQTAMRKTRGDPKANLRRNRHREREKRELMYLRACSQLLEQRLEQLRQRQATLTDGQRRDAFLRQSRVELWRSLALRRCHDRGKSEKENARLRALWRSQQRFVVQLQQLAAVPRGPGPANGHEARVTFGDFDADVLGTLVRDLDTLYEQSDRVLAEMGLVDIPEACFGSIRHRGSGNVDLLGVALLQSNYTALRQLAWERIVSRFLVRGGVRVDTPQQGGRTLAMKIRYHATADMAKTQVGGGDGAEDTHFEIVLALRQYIVSPYREVVVWNSLNTGGGGLAGLVAHETGYCVMYRSIENPESTTLKRARRLELLAARAEEESPKAELFRNLSLAVMEEDVKGALRVFTCEGEPVGQE